MSKMLLILFAVSVVFGREGCSGFAIPMNRDYGNQTMQDSLAMSRSQIDNSWRTIGKPLAFQDDWKVELLKEYDLYKTECYKDSTLYENRLTTDYRGSDSLGFIYPVCRYESGYDHRQPTFEGFMEYLKRKVQWQ
jgi:hypothetical protein